MRSREGEIWREKEGVKDLAGGEEASAALPCFLLSRSKILGDLMLM